MKVIPNYADKAGLGTHPGEHGYDVREAIRVGKYKIVTDSSGYHKYSLIRLDGQYWANGNKAWFLTGEDKVIEGSDTTIPSTTLLLLCPVT